MTTDLNALKSRRAIMKNALINDDNGVGVFLSVAELDELIAYIEGLTSTALRTADNVPIVMGMVLYSSKFHYGQSRKRMVVGMTADKITLQSEGSSQPFTADPWKFSVSKEFAENAQAPWKQVEAPQNIGEVVPLAKYAALLSELAKIQKRAEVVEKRAFEWGCGYLQLLLSTKTTPDQATVIQQLVEPFAKEAAQKMADAFIPFKGKVLAENCVFVKNKVSRPDDRLDAAMQKTFDLLGIVGSICEAKSWFEDGIPCVVIALEPGENAK